MRSPRCWTLWPIRGSARVCTISRRSAASGARGGAGPAACALRRNGIGREGQQRRLRSFLAFRAAAPDVASLVGAEVLIGRAIAAGGKGTICGMANLVPALVRRLFHDPTAQAAIEQACRADRRHSDPEGGGGGDVRRTDLAQRPPAAARHRCGDGRAHRRDVGNAGATCRGVRGLCDERRIEFIQRARDLAPMLDEAGDEIEQRRELPGHVVSALIEGGFFRMLQPRFLGGAELRPVLFCQVTEALAQAERVGRVVRRPEQRLLDVGGVSGSRRWRREIFGPPTGILAWGPPGAPYRGAAGRGRLSHQRHVAVRQRLPPRELAWRAYACWDAARCAPCCSRNPACRWTISGTRSDCAAPAATNTW